MSKRNFSLYVAGRLVSLIGTGVQMVAVPLYILDLTGSGTVMGIFTMLGILPRLLMAPFAGVMGDRFNRRNMMVNMDYARGAVIFLLAALVHMDVMNITILFVAQAAVSIMDAVFGSATMAMLPDLVPREHLTRANSIMGSINGLSMIIGPVLGGIIYGLWGIEIVFLVNATSFVLSAVSEMFISYSWRPQREALTLKRLFAEIKEGLVFTYTKRGLFYLLIFAMLLNALLGPLFSVVVPYILRKVIGFSASQFGYLEGFFTGGILLGNVVIAMFLSRKPTGNIMKSGLVIQIGLMFAMSFVLIPSIIDFLGGNSWLFFGVIGAFMFLMGVFNALINTPFLTNVQKLVPSEIRARTFSIIEVIVQIAVPLGSVIYGFLLDHVASHITYFVVAVVSLITTIVFVNMAPEESFNPE